MLQALGECFSPEMIRFYCLCFLWYSSSAVTNNIAKQIMNEYRYPLTLTMVQFGFVSSFSMLYAQGFFRLGKIKQPTFLIIRKTLPLGLFQVFGHFFSSMAFTYVPVSFVHTIKVYGLI